MAINLITGHAGEAHITADDMGRFNYSIFGKRAFILPTGRNMQYEIVSGTEMRIHDGDAVFWGRHISIPNGTYETVTFPNVPQGMKRIDAVCLGYRKDTQTGIEQAYVSIKNGYATSGNPAPPEIPYNRIIDGVTISEVALYYVLLEDMAISSVEYALESNLSLSDLDELYKRNKALEEEVMALTELLTVREGGIVPQAGFEINRPRAKQSGNIVTVSFTIRNTTEGIGTANTHVARVNGVALPPGVDRDLNTCVDFVCCCEDGAVGRGQLYANGQLLMKVSKNTKSYVAVQFSYVIDPTEASAISEDGEV